MSEIMSGDDDKRLSEAQRRLDRMLKRIEPFVMRSKKVPTQEIGRWRQGIDLPEDSRDSYRAEYYGLQD